MDELPIEQSRSQPVNPSHVTINGLAHICDQASQRIGDVRREFTRCGLKSGLESSFNPSRLGPAQQELQKKKKKQRYKNSEHC